MGSNCRMEIVVEALKLFLQSLPAGCMFEIISFGSNHELLSKSNGFDYNDETLKFALNEVSKFSHNMGGTEAVGPLNSAFSIPLKSKF